MEMPGSKAGLVSILRAVTRAVHAEVKDLCGYDDHREHTNDDDCGKFFSKFFHDDSW